MLISKQGREYELITSIYKKGSINSIYSKSLKELLSPTFPREEIQKDEKIGS